MRQITVDAFDTAVFANANDDCDDDDPMRLSTGFTQQAEHHTLKQDSARYETKIYFIDSGVCYVGNGKIPRTIAPGTCLLGNFTLENMHTAAELYSMNVVDVLMESCEILNETSISKRQWLLERMLPNRVACATNDTREVLWGHQHIGDHTLLPHLTAHASFVRELKHSVYGILYLCENAMHPFLRPTLTQAQADASKLRHV
jgi:hypothetical protein